MRKYKLCIKFHDDDYDRIVTVGHWDFTEGLLSYSTEEKDHIINHIPFTSLIEWSIQHVDVEESANDLE